MDRSYVGQFSCYCDKRMTQLLEEGRFILDHSLEVVHHSEEAMLSSIMVRSQENRSLRKLVMLLVMLHRALSSLSLLYLVLAPSLLLLEDLSPQIMTHPNICLRGDSLSCQADN